MAKRRKSQTTDVAAQTPMPSGGSNGNWDVGIRSADNGAVINISHNTGGKNPKYESKTLVATSPRHAFRIAAAHLPSLAKKVGKKKGGRGKKFALKKS
jgi:hypothetical protein